MSEATASGKSRVFLIDGSGYIFRAFHALPPMTRSDGTPVNAVRGFCSMLLKLLEDLQADHVAVIFDAGRKTFRNDIYPEYKAHRPPPPEELVPQFALIRDATRAFNLPCIEMPGFEADDLIATYAKMAEAAGQEAVVVSADKDLMQLVRAGVGLMDPMKSRDIGPDEVMAKFGVSPDKVVDVQALAGDSTDNVPGVPGIGVKTAAQLITEYGDLDTLLARAEEIKQPKRRQNLIEHADMARISRELVRLKDDVDVPVGLDGLEYAGPDADTLLAFMDTMEFRSLKSRVQARMGQMGGTGSSSETAAETGDTSSDPALSAPIDTSAYETVTTVEALAKWVEQARAAGIVAVDTETTSLDAMRAELVGISLATAPGKACYIPLAHKSAPPQGEFNLGGETTPEQAPLQIALAEAQALLGPLFADPAVLKIGHNIKYDMHILEGVGLCLAPYDDTIVMSYVVDGSDHGHGMDELAEMHFGHTTIKFSDVCGSGKNQITFDFVPLDQATTYAAEDADITLRLHGLLKKALLDARLMSVYQRLDRPQIAILAAMEHAGVLVDAGVLTTLSREFERRMADLETEIHQLAGRDFNVNSPSQLGEILFEDMGLPGGKKSKKTGKWSTGADVLETLAGQGHDLPVRVLEYRQLAKLKSTYTDALIRDIHPKTGRVHTSYSQTVTSTGRLSSNSPNLQNIPIRTEEGRKIREAFTAPDGHVLISADYSQIELRLVAHVANIAALKQAFIEGQDIHAATASQVFGVPIDGMDPMVRRRAKAINFGIIYGISAFGLANQLSISRGEAKEYIDAYFARFPEIRDYMDRTVEEAKSHGCVYTPFGRRCAVPGIKDSNPARRSFAERAAINAPIQGGAADIIKRAMNRLPDDLLAAGLKTTMLLQVHDELIFEAPEAEADKAVDLIRTVMEAAADLGDVPLVADAGIAKTWAEAH